MSGILAPIEQQIEAERPIKSEYEIRREEYAEALRQAGISNTRVQHDPFWRERWLSIQNAHDAYKGKSGSMVWKIVGVLFMTAQGALMVYGFSLRH